MTYYILYNPKANNDQGKDNAEKAAAFYPGENIEKIDITGIGKDFFDRVFPDDAVILCGGDGTLNHFVNDFDVQTLPCELLFFACGSGNDFLRDVGKEPGAAPFPVKRFLQNLPSVTVKGKTYRFFNGVGYGIDGYCCEVGEKIRATSTKPINYTSIAIKGLLFHYHPTNATVIADGKEHRFKKVWIAPTMNGHYYGGGMMPTPDQDRMHNETVSTMIWHGSGKIKTLMNFPSIFKGEHVKRTEMVKLFHSKEVTVRFDRPTALQIDGETIPDVTEYTVKAGNRASEPAMAAAKAETVSE